MSFDFQDRVQKSKNVIEYLVKKFNNKKPKNNRGENPLHYALKYWNRRTGYPQLQFAESFIQLSWDSEVKVILTEMKNEIA